MKPGNVLCEITEPDLTEASAACVESVARPASLRLEASDFERLLEHAAEVLSLRERIAA